MNNLVEAALNYAANGYHVFPCKPKSKKPATQNGCKDATTDEADIRRWWGREPNYNIGIRTGPPSGFWVLDVDGAKGRESYRKYQSDIPWNTPNVNTPSGGFHLYFAWDDRAENLRNSVKSLPGLDVRTEGGYVLAPGSILDNGVYEYQGSHRGPTEAPERLLRALCLASERTVAAPVAATIPVGTRNNSLFSLARSLFLKGLDENEVYITLDTVNQSRCRPPLETSEVVQITNSAGSNKYDRGELKTESSSSSSPKRNDDDDDYTLPKMRRFSNMELQSGERPYIVEGLLFAGFAGSIYGDGGSAKSLLMMHMTQCVARGQEWLGYNTTKTNVLYLDFELDEDEQSRRAYEVAAGLGYSELPDNCFYIAGAGYKSKDVFEYALEVCKEHNIKMVIVDSLGYALNGDAEASRDVLGFFRDVEGSFRREGISLQNVDHQSKGGNYQEKSIFGSVYKSNSVRSVMQVEPGERGDGYMNLTIRHKKVNFGPLLEPFGVRVEFRKGEVEINVRKLDAGELAGERTLNSYDRILMVLGDGPMYPEDISEVTGLDLGTVKNTLTKARKAGEVEDTGNQGKFGVYEVRLKSSSSSLITRDDDDYDDVSALATVPF